MFGLGIFRVVNAQKLVSADPGAPTAIEQMAIRNLFRLRRQRDRLRGCHEYGCADQENARHSVIVRHRHFIRGVKSVRLLARVIMITCDLAFHAQTLSAGPFVQWDGMMLGIQSAAASERTAMVTTNRVLLCLLVCVFFSNLPVCGSDKASSAVGLQFEEAEGTGLSDILKARRVALEKQQGAPLKGHQWWLWGLGKFDYDLDGDIDLIVSIHGGSGGLIIRNNLAESGKLTFTDVTKELGVDGLVPATDNYPLVWDFNGDGYLDIAGLLDDSKTPCLWNEQGKRFTKAEFSLHPINYPDEIRDLNGDGYIDIAQSRRGKRIQFLYDAQANSFTRDIAAIDPLAGLPTGVQDQLKQVFEEPNNRFINIKRFEADLNGDGRSDLILRAFGSYSGDRLGWYLIADESGKLIDATQDAGLPREGAPLLVEDLDHDGDIDLLTASADQAGLFLNDGAGKFTRQEGPLTDFVKRRCPYLHFARRADLNHDGDLELAISNRRYGRQMVFENQGAGKFQPVLSVKGWDADPLVLCDINADGLLDVVVGGAGEKENIGVFLNVTKNPGNGSQLSLREKAPNIYAVGARVELYRAGTLGKPDAIPMRTADAHVDGSPIHLGLGEDETFDLRVRFSDDHELELKDITVKSKMTVGPQGVIRE